jgi:pyrroline-5-carboxylate reductase
VEISKKLFLLILGNMAQAIIRGLLETKLVKPQNMLKIFDEIRNFVRKNTIIISIAAGITTRFIEENIKKDVAVIRAMPNTPALVRCGATALCKGRFVSVKQLQRAKICLFV